ncbi:MAG: DUF2809 domain-containing protein [Burkholderiales bacterium]|jgi:hypothetical protein|nr:DUF2809 domain-containing protein [Burkholderiales bacterium]
MKRRHVLAYAAAVLAVIGIGLASRRWPGMFPAALGKYPGDALWALMVFVGCGMLRPRAPSWRVAATALAISFAVEFSQLYQAPWINAIRGTVLGHLVLGSTFNVPDLFAYVIGVAVGLLAERVFLHRRAPANATT